MDKTDKMDKMDKMSEVYSSRIRKGSRTYFFDVRRNGKGDYFLTITECKKANNSVERHRIMIFEEDMSDFLDAFQTTLDEFSNVRTLENNIVQ